MTYELRLFVSFGQISSWTCVAHNFLTINARAVELPINTFLECNLAHLSILTHIHQI